MGGPFEVAIAQLDAAVATLFSLDSTVRAVGIGEHEGAFGFRAVRNTAAIVPLSGIVNFAATPTSGPIDINGVPLSIVDSPGDVRFQVIVPDTTADTHALASTIPERSPVDTLVAGLQIENFDEDARRRADGSLNFGFLIVGTLGCFVTLADGRIALLSNNHVVAGENHGVLEDRIDQPGTVNEEPTREIANLSQFQAITPSPRAAFPPDPTVLFNNIDAGIAIVKPGLFTGQGYLPIRNLPVPQGTATPQIGDKVFKVGRTTGLTRGTITNIRTVVGPVPYRDGPSWFRNSFEIEGIDGTQFSDHGDSGSAIVRESGEIVGLLYAGNGTQTYACTIENILTAFGCVLA